MRAMWKTILTIGLLIVLISTIHAKDLVWHKGSVVLTTNEVVVGDIARQGFELLLLRAPEGQVSVYPTHKVSSFRYYDAEEKVNRMFIKVDRKYYERVSFGKITLLRIQKQFDETMDEKHSGNYDFFIQEGEKVCSLHAFRRKYFDRVKEDLSLRLVPYKHLDPNTRYGAVSLILLYNKIEVPLASASI
jgi:hypothetical protein